MCFAQALPVVEYSGREWLSWFSDCLGVSSFFFMLLGVVFGWLINRRIQAAREDAIRTIEYYGNALLQQGIIDTKQSLLLAQESIATRHWVRSRVHLDVAIDRMLKQIRNDRIAENMKRVLRDGIDNMRVVQVALANESTGKGQLEQKTLKLLESMIHEITMYEGSLKRLRPVEIP